MESLYKFLGYKLISINFNHKPKEKLKEIRLQIENSQYQNGSIHLISSVELDYEESKGNKFVYISGYEINSKNIINEFENNENSPEKDQFFSVLYASVFPFIRESISVITKDSGEHILLPIIDCRGISLKETLVITPNYTE